MTGMTSGYTGEAPAKMIFPSLIERQIWSEAWEQIRKELRETWGENLERITIAKEQKK